MWTRADGLMVRYEVCRACIGTMREGGPARDELRERIEATLEAGSAVVH
jgi:hypothetical protein